MNERYSFAFLMRPENQAPMMPLLGPSALTDEKDVLTSEDWIKAKFGILRGDTTRDRNRILTGREAITI
jgi:hypothetical protein